MEIELPSRLIRARSIRVEWFNCVDVGLDLDFGVQIRKRIIIEGIQPRDVPKKFHSAARHCMIVLLGGKRLIIRVDPGADRRDGILLGRVYLAEETYGDPPGMRVPHGLDKKLLEVGEFFQYLLTKKFEDEYVKRALNKRTQARAAELESHAS